MDRLTKIAYQHYHPVKPIKYWQVKQCGRVIAENNSVAILKSMFKDNKNVTFHSVR